MVASRGCFPIKYLDPVNGSLHGLLETLQTNGKNGTDPLHPCEHPCHAPAR